jgi:hypothetical protein
MMQSMVIQMNDRQLQTLAQLQVSLDGTTVVDFAVAAEERYGFIGRTVRRFFLRAPEARIRDRRRAVRSLWGVRCGSSPVSRIPR